MIKQSLPVVPGLFLVLIFMRAGPVMARSYDMYRADFEKGAFCSAIGGACASDDDLEDGFFQNPAALAIRADYWNFDGDYDASSNQEPGMKGPEASREARFMFGAGFTLENWGYGFSVTSRKDRANAAIPVTDRNGDPAAAGLAMRNSLGLLNFAVGRKLGDGLCAGAGLTAMRFDEDLSFGEAVDVRSGRPRAAPGLALTAGLIDTVNKKFRVGGWFRTPLVFHNRVSMVSGSFLEPLDYHANMALRMPWMLAGGVSYMPWADARTLLFDLNVIGDTPGGYQLNTDAAAGALSDQRLRAKGRRVTFEPRLGFRAPWTAGSRFTLLAGSYYEAGRWDKLPGRFHFTGGAAYKTFKWLELMGGLDVAKGFFQLFLTFR